MELLYKKTALQLLEAPLTSIDIHVDTHFFKTGLFQVKAVQIHNLDPGFDEVTDELMFIAGFGVNL